MLVDDRAIFAFYATKLPADVRDSPSFETWYKEAQRTDAKLLFLAKADLMRHGAESVTEALFPKVLRMGEHTPAGLHGLWRSRGSVCTSNRGVAGCTSQREHAGSHFLTRRP